MPEPVNSAGLSALSAMAPPGSGTMTGSAPPWLPGGAPPQPGNVYSLILPALCTAPASARRRVRLVLARWGIPREKSADAELLASELVTNAVLFGPGSGSDPSCLITMALWRLPGSLVIEVSDQSPRLPGRQSPDISREGGRGLVLVAELSREWGCYAPAPGRKTVYCVVGLGGEIEHDSKREAHDD